MKHKKPLDPEKCREMVWNNSGNWGHHSYQCSFRRLPNSEFCGVHDPERKKARAAKRGPTVWEREEAERKRKRKIGEAKDKVVAIARRLAAEDPYSSELQKTLEALDALKEGR